MEQLTRETWGALGVWIGEEVDPACIAAGAVLHPGTHIRGSATSIGPGCVLGAEAPTVVENCQLGRNVELKGGYFSGSVFLDGANMGSGAHLRPGCILEEEANGAHGVGLKQTILLSFTTLGSLINFCDILMAGGTSRKNHSEVGSSYIHFNFTPHQDKATASLVGDVANGVFLDQEPIFLGGQGGLVGPARIAYGTVVAAGGICRQDILEPGQLHVADAPTATTRPYQSGVYRNIGRIVHNNLLYIGNIIALREWYRTVRSLSVRDAYDQAVLDGGIKNLDLVLNERTRRLEDLAGKMDFSVQWLEEKGGTRTEIEAQKRFAAAWPEIESRLQGTAGRPPVAFIESMNAAATGLTHVQAVRTLDAAARETGRAWLQSMVDGAGNLWSD